jgi:hypothetical protein
VEVALYIEAIMEPAASHQPTSICYRWCLVMMEAVIAVAHTGTDVALLVYAMAKAIAAETLALVGEGYIWLGAAMLALLFFYRSVAA